MCIGDSTELETRIRLERSHLEIELVKSHISWMPYAVQVTITERYFGVLAEKGIH